MTLVVLLLLISFVVCTDDRAAWEAEKAEWEREKEEWIAHLHEELEAALDAGSCSVTVEGRQEVVAEVPADRAVARDHILGSMLALQTQEYPPRALHHIPRQMGFAAYVHGLTLALSLGAREARLVFAEPVPFPWIYSANPAAAKTHSSFFLPLAPSFRPALADTLTADAIASPLFSDEVVAAIVSQNPRGDAYAEAVPDHRGAGGGPMAGEPLVRLHQGVWGAGNTWTPPWLPALVPSLAAGSSLPFFYRSIVTSYVWRLNAATTAAVAARTAALSPPLSTPCTSVHIRRGAKWTETPDLPLSAYRTALLSLPRTPSLYVATDDASVARSVVADWSDVWNVTLGEAHRFDGAGESGGVSYRDEIRRRWSGGGNDALDLIADVEHLARCDYFVGTMSSNVGRLVVELQFARRLVDPLQAGTSISLDGPWKTDP
jgi:hypothetical protein